MTGAPARKQKRTVPKFMKPAPTGSSVFTTYIGELHVGPWQQSRMSLGTYSTNHPAKGFSLNLTSDFAPSDEITTQIISEMRGPRHEFILHIANRTDKIVDIEVWQMQN